MGHRESQSQRKAHQRPRQIIPNPVTVVSAAGDYFDH